MKPRFVLRSENTPLPYDQVWEPTDLCLLAIQVRKDQPLLARIKVGATWRTNRWFDSQCLACKIPLVYIGWTVDGAWAFRWKCPQCGCESETMHPGYRPATPDRPYGGLQKRATSARRRRAGY